MSDNSWGTPLQGNKGLRGLNICLSPRRAVPAQSEDRAKRGIATTSVAARATLVCCEVRTDNQPGCRPFNQKDGIRSTGITVPTDNNIVNGHNIPEEQKPYILGPAAAICQ